jgi:hypothetical protein
MSFLFDPSRQSLRLPTRPVLPDRANLLKPALFVLISGDMETGMTIPIVDRGTALSIHSRKTANDNFE